MDALATSERADGDGDASAPPEPTARSTRRLLFQVLGVWAVIVVAVLGLAWAFIGTGEVAGTSMEPTLLDGDTLVVATRSTPEVDDIVTAEVFDRRGKRSIVKRVIGVAGDELSYRSCRLVRNGVVVAEPYVHPDSSVGRCGEGFGPIVVPAGTVWLMGDNRAHSTDSRVHGPFDLDQVDGVMLFTI